MNANAIFIITALITGLTATQVLAARYVVVNGQRLNPNQIQYLDQLSCGYVPDGRYWLDARSGIWGYENGGPQGHISADCNTQRRPSLSERGLLYSPGELLR